MNMDIKEAFIVAMQETRDLFGDGESFRWAVIRVSALTRHAI